MKEPGEGGSDLFLELVHDLQMSALMQLGKIVHPLTKKTERNLPAAKGIIDLLGTLETKTRGNLSDEEQRFLQHVLTTLRLNYVDEAGRPDDEPEPSQDGAPETPKEAGGQGEHGAS